MRSSIPEVQTPAICGPQTLSAASGADVAFVLRKKNRRLPSRTCKGSFLNVRSPVLAPADFTAVRAFLAVADAQSFSRAAEALGVSPSSLSQMVRGLEDRLGTRLLNRTTRSMSLTDEGRTLVGRMAPAVAEMTDAFATVRRGAGRPAGRVRIHAFRLGAELFLTPILASFARRYPEIVLDISLDDQVVDLVAAGFDLGIRLGEVIQRGMAATRLGPNMRQVAVASPTYLAEHGRPAEPRDLLRHRCIRWRWPGQAAPYKWEFHDGTKPFEILVDGPIVVDSFVLAQQAALDGVGIAFMAEEITSASVRRGDLETLLPGWTAPFPGFHLCYSNQRQIAPAVRVVIETLGTAPREA